MLFRKSALFLYEKSPHKCLVTLPIRPIAYRLEMVKMAVGLDEVLMDPLSF